LVRGRAESLRVEKPSGGLLPSFRICPVGFTSVF
jgi:hypothetical protein